ncbi:MAG: hypothetical protein IJS66_01110 [Bacteroidales bacterium]|nr:hypothetical protein [Bacteroidales bacterium]
MDYLLVDAYDNNVYGFVTVRFAGRLVEVRPPEILKSRKAQWFTGALKVLHRTRRSDRIVFLFDFQAVIAWWICRLTFRKRRFICVNLLLDQKDSFKNRIASALYRKALASPDFTATVTSLEYGSWLNSRLGVNASYILMRDVYHGDYAVMPATHRYDVFCGGRNGRDWEFYRQLAASMPGLEFVAVMPSAPESGFSRQCPANLHIMSDIRDSEFLEAMSASSLVCLPLTKQAPAGLIVLFQAAANRKPVVITDTVTSREYCSCGRGLLVENKIEKWQAAVRQCLDNPSESLEMAVRLRNFCEAECSQDKFLSELETLLS